MQKAGWGRIVTISSAAGLRPSLTGIQAYSAAKHALVGLTKQLSGELAPHGITVNSVAPGLILSNPSTLKQWQSYGPERQSQIVDTLHTRRLGSPQDIAAAALFLVQRAGGLDHRPDSFGRWRPLLGSAPVRWLSPWSSRTSRSASAPSPPSNL